MKKPTGKPDAEGASWARTLVSARGERAGSAIADFVLGLFSRSKSARQLELYRAKLQILEREYASHSTANRQQAAEETLVSVENERALIRQLCRESGLELPPEILPDD